METRTANRELKLLFHVREEYEIDIKDRERAEKIELFNSIAMHKQMYKAKFNKNFIHLSDKIFVEKGVWENVVVDEDSEMVGQEKEANPK